MVKSSPWIKFIPLLGLALLVIIAAAITLLWFSAGDSNRSDGGRLMAFAQDAGRQVASSLASGGDNFGELQSLPAQVKSLRQQVAGTTGPGAQLAAAPAWRDFDSSLNGVVEKGEAVEAVIAERELIISTIPQLLAATGNMAAAMSNQVLLANQRFLEQMELNLAEIRQQLPLLMGPGADPELALSKIMDASGYIDRVARSLGGEDEGLGVTPVQGAAIEELGTVRELVSRLRASLSELSAIGEDLVELQNQELFLQQATDTLMARFSALSSAPTQGASGLLGNLPVLLLAVGLVVALLLLFAFYRAADVRRAIAAEAQRNERNQQAILTLLDELSSLADGDLTVQATVTEDITGAIADSINYAIEALRELVVTVRDSAYLVDAATKQTDATARHLVRSSETQARQIGSASESTAQMAITIEEVSGNAERCSDVARHSVDVAHKGGEAVRRTIEGMNTIRETIQDTSKRIKRLGESSQEIGNIVELINDIAEQTNILALNASIQASMAGEAGRGFAVVADEVQRLAERSANATKQIEVLVSTIQSDTNEAVVSMERSTTDVVGGALLAENAGAALEEIEQVSNQIANLVQNISSSAREQSDTASGITRNMQVLREISSKTTQHTNVTSSAISKLTELATQLRKSVAGFRLPDQGPEAPALDDAPSAGAPASTDEAVPVVSAQVDDEPEPQRRSV